MLASRTANVQEKGKNAGERKENEKQLNREEWIGPVAGQGQEELMSPSGQLTTGKKGDK